MKDSNNLPSRIGRYEVKDLLGSGAMGCVYLAEDPRIKRQVAIKVVKLDDIKGESERLGFLARFQREAEISGVLNDPGIVTIYDVGESDAGPFLAMEYVAGLPLEDYVKAPDMLGLTLSRKMQIAASIAAALDHAHAQGIIHRDVKPGNVIITEEGRPKLMDFGIAKRENVNLTQTGTFIGTPSYACPERILDGPSTPKSDIFSFGVLVFELLSGSLPFPGTSINTILYKIVNEAPSEVHPPVMGLVPEGWQRVFAKVLAKDPEERHSSCAAFVLDLLSEATQLDNEARSELASFLRHGSHAVARTSILSRPREETAALRKRGRHGSGIYWAMGIAFLAVLGVGGFFLFVKAGKNVTFLVEPAAKVMMEGREIGATGAPIPLKVGARVTLRRDGYVPQEYVFDGRNTRPAFTLKPRITSETLRTLPEGAMAVLDGAALEGRTPLEVPKWDHARKHNLTFTHGSQVLAVQFDEGEVPGNAVYTLVTVAEAAKSGVVKKVEADAPGHLRLLGDFSVQIRVNGKELKGRELKGQELKAGGERITLATGNYKLELSNPKVFYRETRHVTIQPGQTNTVNLPGLVSLTVFHPAGDVIFIDGVSTGIESDGTTPIRLTKGRHMVTIQGRSASRVIELKADHALRFKL